MLERVTLDTSFLVNITRLNVLQYICKIFSEILISPKVWNESFQFHEHLEELPCIKRVTLSKEEQQKVNVLHDHFTANFPGEHLGEIEALVLAETRGYFLVISDNFAPWYIRKDHPEFSNVKIYRGSYFITRLIEMGFIGKKILDDLKGIYSQKEIDRIRERLK